MGTNLLLCAACLLAPQERGDAAGPRFEEAQDVLGLGDLMPAWGLAWNDFDGDGDPDLYVANHMHFPSALYENRSGLFFRAVDTTLGREAGMDNHMGAWADCDGDGDADCYTANGFYRQDHLLRNDGDGRFTRVTEPSGASLGHLGRGRTAMWMDFSGNGWDDLLVSNMATPDRYYLNLGEGRFREQAAEAGLSNPFGKVGALAGDLDGDGDVDIFAPVLQPPTSANMLFLNRGDGSFVEASRGSGTAIRGKCGGSALGDYDNDGDLDLYVSRSDSRGDQLFRNRGDATFENVTRESGIRLRALDGEGMRGAVFADLDNDGDLDLYVTRSGTERGGNPQNVLFLNRGDGTFVDFTAQAGAAASNSGKSASVAVADVNGDGLLEVAVTSGASPVTISGPLILLRNLTPTASGTAHWCRVLPERDAGSREGSGARVRARLPGGATLMREANGTRVLAQDEPGVHLGLGRAEFLEQVAVTWPDGSIACAQGVPADSTVLVPAAPKPRFIDSHPAALLGEVPAFDLNAARARLRTLLGDRPLPEADPDDLARRRDAVLAYFLARELASNVELRRDDLQAELNDHGDDFVEPPRYWIEHVAVGDFDDTEDTPPEPRPLAKAIAQAMRNGEEAEGLVRRVGIRAYGRARGIRKVRGIDTEYEPVKGYFEDGWQTPAMLAARFGPELAGRIMELPVGGVLGPLDLPELRDVHELETVWPVFRVIRLVRKEAREPRDLAELGEDLRRAVRRKWLRRMLLEAAPAAGEPASPSRCLLLEGVRFAVAPLADAARARGMAERPEVAAALARAGQEARLDAAFARLAASWEPGEEELAAYRAARAENWTRPAEVAGLRYFFLDEHLAREAHKRILEGTGPDEVARELDIPPLQRRAARSNVTFSDPVVMSASLCERIFGDDAFEVLRKVTTGQVSPIFACGEGFHFLVVEEQHPPRALDAETARARATAELRGAARERLLDRVLFGE